MEQPEDMKPENNWQQYYEKTKDKPPRPLLKEAVNLVYTKGEALDLGSGAMNDTKYLAAIGFKHVTAVDANAQDGELLQTMPADTVLSIVSAFDAFDFKENTYDLINAQYSLPFNSPNTFDEVFDRLKKSLRVQGVFTGQFFGKNDEWNTAESGMTFHTVDEAKELLSDLEIVELREEETDKKTAVGNMKHWHVIHIIARKK